MTVPVELKKETLRRPARVVVLRDAEQRLEATITEMSDKAIRLTVPFAIPNDCAIRIDSEDCIFLGEVAGCLRTSEGFECMIWLEEVLTGVESLRHLMTSLMGAQEKPALWPQTGRFSGTAGEGSSVASPSRNELHSPENAFSH